MVRLGRPHVRYFARPPPDPMMVFDRGLKRLQRDHAAFSPRRHEYLRDEVASRLVDRLDDIRKKFPVAADIGCNTGNIARALGKRGGIQKLVHIDSSAAMLAKAKEENSRQELPFECEYIQCDEEKLDSVLKEDSLDLVLSSFSMHWINNLPGFLSSVLRALKPDGCFLAAMPGGATLQELRSAFTVADMERCGGVSPHVSPFVQGRDCGDLLGTCGFALPTVDTESIVVRYADMFTLIEHLQGMGESNVSLARARSVSRDVFLAAAAAYEELYADSEGLLPATFQIFYLIGWKPHPSQPKPADRGSATHKIAALNALLQQELKRLNEELVKNANADNANAADSTKKDG